MLQIEDARAQIYVSHKPKECHLKSLFMRAYHCRNIVKYIVASIAPPNNNESKWGTRWPTDWLSYICIYWHNSDMHCTALPLPSDLVTAGFHTNTNENAKQQTSSSGLSNTGGERPQAWEQLEHCAGREQIGTQSAVSSQLETAQQAALFPQSTSNSQSTHNCRRGCSVLAS